MGSAFHQHSEVLPQCSTLCDGMVIFSETMKTLKRRMNCERKMLYQKTYRTKIN